MNKLYVVRHGKTDWNNLGIMQGLTDIPLNNQGINEAKQLASNMNLDNIDICICSPLIRAKQTAEILVNKKIEILYDDLLMERSFGDYEGKKADYDLIATHWDYKKNDSNHNIESIKQCLDRAEKFLSKINKNYNNKKILIVSHGSFIKALHFVLKGYNENTDFLSFNAKNTTVYEYDF